MSYFFISFKNSIVYRSGVIFSIIGSIIWMLISMALWTFVYQHDASQIEYMITYVILSQIIGMFYSGGMSDAIAGKVHSGDFALDLIRPVNFLAIEYSRLLGTVCSTVLLRGVPVVLVFLPVLIQNARFNSVGHILCAVLAVMLSHILYIVIYSLIGFMSFTFFEVWPFNRLMNDTIRLLSGSFIPLALFPHWLGAIASILPFRFMYSFPIQLLIGEIGWDQILQNFIILCVWLTALGALLLLTYKRSINKCIVQGG